MRLFHIFIRITILTSGLCGFAPLSAETKEHSFTQPNNQAVLVYVTHFGDNLKVDIQRDGARVSSPLLHTSIAEPMLMVLPADSDEKEVRVIASASGFGKSAAGIDITHIALQPAQASLLQSILLNLSQFQTQFDAVNLAQEIYQSLQSPLVPTLFRNAVNHQLLLIASEHGHWREATRLARQVATYNDRRLLLECRVLKDKMDYLGDSATDNATVVESLGRIATQLSFLYRTRLAIPKTADGELSLPAYQHACDPVLTHKNLNLGLTVARFSKQNWTSDDDAMRLFEYVLSKVDSLPPASSAHVHSQLWFYYNFLPDHLEAMRVGKTAIALSEAHPESNLDIMSLYKVVPQSMRASGQYAEAKALIEKGLAQSSNLAPSNIAMLLNSMAFTYSQLGEFDLANRYLDLYLSTLAKDGSQFSFSKNQCQHSGKYKIEVARAMVKLGSVAKSKGNITKASEYLSCANILLSDVEDYYNVVLAVTQAELAWAKSEYAYANAKANVALDEFNPVGLTKIDALLIKLKYQMRTELDALSAISTCNGKTDDLRCELANLFRYDTFYTDKISNEINTRYPARQLTTFTLLIKIHSQLKQQDWVEHFSRKAQTIIELEQESIENLQAWKAARYEFVETLVELQLAKGLSESTLDALFDLLEAHYSLEPEKENKLYTTQISDPKSQTKTLSLYAVRQQMADRDLLVRFFASREEMLALYVSKEEAGIHRIGKRADVDALADITLTNIHEGKSLALRQSSLFSTLLPTSVLQRLQPEKIVIIPDGQLHKLPFAMLNVAKDTQQYHPLAKTHQVLLTTSASRYYSSNTASILRSAKYDISVFADPKLPQSFSQDALLASRQVSGMNFYALPGTKIEADSIRSNFPTARLNLGVQESATRDFLLSADTRSSRLLHIATHGYFEPEAIENIGLVMSEDAELGIPGIFKLSELMSKPVSAQLVVMSGCETFLGKYYKGSGMRSMTRGFLAQGAGSTISTLWPVQDRATAHFMKRFYTNLGALQNTSKALQATQRQMATSGRFRHPKHWSGFVLTSTNRQFETFHVNTITALN